MQGYQARAQTAENEGQSVDWNAVQQNLRQFGVETRQSLQSYLGENLFNTLQRNNVFTTLGNQHVSNLVTRGLHSGELDLTTTKKADSLVASPHPTPA